MKKKDLEYENSVMRMALREISRLGSMDIDERTNYIHERYEKYSIPLDGCDPTFLTMLLMKQEAEDAMTILE